VNECESLEMDQQNHCCNAHMALGFANPAVFSKPVFFGLESCNPGFGFGFASDWRTGDVMGLNCHVTRPSACLFNIHRCQTAFHVHEHRLLPACTTPTIRNWTPESDWKHSGLKVNLSSIIFISSSIIIDHLHGEITTDCHSNCLCFFLQNFKSKSSIN